MSVKDPNPLARPAVWSLSGSTTSIDATTYYTADSDYQDTAAITNTAGDTITGLKKRQAEISMSVRLNSKASPFETAGSFINRTNSQPWANGAARTWLCTGGSAQQATELVGDEVIDYWQVGYSFAYRPDGWDLRVPNVGLFQLVEGAKQRIMLSDADGNDVPAAKPQPLNSDGTVKAPSDPVDILTFVIYQSVDFAEHIGSPPV